MWDAYAHPRALPPLAACLLRQREAVAAAKHVGLDKLVPKSVYTGDIQ
jgi:hypothetical protein